MMLFSTPTQTTLHYRIVTPMFLGGENQQADATQKLVAAGVPLTHRVDVRAVADRRVGQVAAIRAVNVDSVVRTLVARGLITEVFTDPDTGAINYGTTDALLVNLGINSLEELPHISPLLDDGADGFESEVLR